MALDASSAPQIIEHVSKSVTYTPFVARWVPSSARFVSMGLHPRGTGVIEVYSLEQGKLNRTVEVEKANGIKCATFNASAFEQRHVATGDYKGYLNVWDLERLDKPVFNVQAHQSIINSIDGCGGLNIGYGAPEIVTGSRDGCVRIWDPRQQEPVAAVEPADGQQPRDCWAVAFGNSFSDEERCVCAGYDNGDIKLLDLKMNKLRWETNIKNGVVHIEFDRRDIEMNKLAVAGLESSLNVYDMRTYNQEEGYASLKIAAHKSTVWQTRFLPQNRDILATTGGNGTMNLYKYVYPESRKSKDAQGVERGVPGKLEQLNSKKLAEQPIVSFDWSPDKQGLAVMAALDQTLKVCIVTKLSSA